MPDYYERILKSMDKKEANETNEEINNLNLIVNDYLEEKPWSETTKQLKDIIIWMAKELSLEAYKDFRNNLIEKARKSNNTKKKEKLYELVATLYNNIKSSDFEKKVKLKTNELMIRRGLISIRLSEQVKIKINFKNHKFDVIWKEILPDKNNENKYYLRIYLEYNGSNDLIKYSRKYKSFFRDIPFVYIWWNKIKVWNNRPFNLWERKNIKVNWIKFTIQIDIRNRYIYINKR